MAFKLKYTNPAFPFKSPLKQGDQNVGVSNMVMNEIAMNRISKVEKEIGSPDKPGGWSDKEKNKLQHSLDILKSVRKRYPITDYSHKEGEYEVK